MSVKRNIFANFAGGIWLALMSLAFVPLYIRLMGVESYGIVGVLVSLQAIFAVLELGLSQVLAREMARLSVDRVNAGRIADTTRTLEIIYWSVAVAVTFAIALLSHFIAYRWLTPDQLPRESLREALLIMAIVVGMRWPVALYIGGLNGLQRQVLVNVILATFATVQSIGTLVVLWSIEPTVRAFLWWQALIALLQVITLRIALWRSLPFMLVGAFRLDVLKGIWRFASGITTISVLAMLLTQADKILLSKLLTLSEFGYYVFATMVAATILRLVGPVFTAYSPRLIELLSRNDHTELVRSYHQSCRVMATVIIAPAITLAVFSKGILQIWTNDQALVSATHLLVSLLVLGNMLNGLVTMPYALQLTYGWTRLAIYMNSFAVIILIPSMYFATLSWGATGAAGVWLILNSGYLLIGVHIMHRHLLKREKWQWYLQDVGMPVLAVFLVVAIGRFSITEEWGALPKILMLIVVTGFAAASAAISSQMFSYRSAASLLSRTRR